MRASSMDKYLACTQSFTSEPGEVLVETPAGEETRLGRAAHAALADYVTKGETDSAAHYADAFQVPADDVAFLIHQGRKCWDELRVYFPEPIVEEALEEHGDLGLTGHPDVLACVGAQARCIDWKSGRVEWEHTEQIRSYGYLALQRFPEAETFWAIVVDLRYAQQREPVEYTRVQLEQWYLDSTNRLQDEPYYNPGAHCTFCRRRLSCEARERSLKHAIVFATTVVDQTDTGNFTDGGLVYAVSRVKELRSALDAIDEALTTEIRVRGGKVLNADGDGIELVAQERREILAKDAWPILLPVIGDAILRTVKMSKTAVEEEIKAVAPYRGKGKLVKQVMEQLEEAGAVLVKTHEVARPIRGLKELGGDGA